LKFILTRTKLSRLKRWNELEANQYLEEIRLLNEKEMIGLFPGAAMLRETVLGITKSITSHTLS